jgi:hypothetical protein
MKRTTARAKLAGSGYAHASAEAAQQSDLQPLHSVMSQSKPEVLNLSTSKVITANEPTRRDTAGSYELRETMKTGKTAFRAVGAALRRTRTLPWRLARPRGRRCQASQLLCTCRVRPLRASLCPPLIVSYFIFLSSPLPTGCRNALVPS